MPTKPITIDDKDYFGDFHNLNQFMGMKDGYESFWQFPDDLCSGFFYLIKLKPGLILTIIKHHSIKPVLVEFNDYGNRFIMSFVLAGDDSSSLSTHVNINDRPQFPALVSPQSYITYTPECSGVMEFPQSTNFYCIGILLEPWLMERFCDDCIPEDFKANLKSPSLNHQYRQSLTITPMMNLRLHEMLGCRYQGISKHYFLESKALELFVLGFEQLKCGKTRNRDDLPFRVDTSDFVVQTRDILLSNMIDPPTLTELSRQVNVNKTTLNRCFRKTYGVSIFEYLRICRLEKSRDLLRSGKKNVTEAALEVGYSQQSCFTTEFKKYFGETPKNFLP